MGDIIIEKEDSGITEKVVTTTTGMEEGSTITEMGVLGTTTKTEEETTSEAEEGSRETEGMEMKVEGAGEEAEAGVDLAITTATETKEGSNQTPEEHSRKDQNQ